MLARLETVRSLEGIIYYISYNSVSPQEFLRFVSEGAASTLASLETARSLEGIFCPHLPATFLTVTRPKE